VLGVENIEQGISNIPACRQAGMMKCPVAKGWLSDFVWLCSMPYTKASLKIEH